MADAVAESSPADVIEVPRDSEAYAQWRLTGKFPEAAATTTPKPDSTTGKTSDSATGGKTQTESGTATVQQGKKTAAPSSEDNAETRVKELLADLKAAGLTPAELKTFKKQATAAETAKPVEPAKPDVQVKAAEAPVKPKIENFETYELFEAAVDKWHEDVADFRVDQKLLARDAKTRLDTQARATTDKLNAASVRYGEGAKETITDAAAKIFNDPKIPPPVKALLDDSPVIADLLYTLGAKAGELTEFIELARTNPGQALRKAVLMEHLIREELAAGDKKPAAAVESGRASDGKFTAPAKKISDAPAPPREAGGRSGVVPDPVERAVANDDFTTFKNEANRRDLARHKGL